jgi:hypothetical protein
MIKRLILLVCLIATLFGLSQKPIPVTGSDLSTTRSDLMASMTFSSFLLNIPRSGDAHRVMGVFVANTLAAPVVQQPANNPGYVSTELGLVTQFNLAAQFGSLALLAHNYLTGNTFFNVRKYQVITVVYGDGHAEFFLVTDIREYEALNPTSPYSDFVQLNRPRSDRISATELFYDVYAVADRLVLQTCIDANGISSWGRLFIIARPISFINL